MFKFIVASALLFVGCPSFAGVRTAGQIKAELKEGVFIATLKDGYHINEKAPNAATVDGESVKPGKTSAREIQFGPFAKGFTRGTAMLYVCDDEVTFCETSQIDMKTGQEIMPTTKAAAPKPEEKSKKKKKKKGAVEDEPIVDSGKTNKFGFYVDQYDRALKEAKETKKLLLVDFSARWCPGCVRLEDEIFPEAEFKKLTANFVKVKIDVDRFENSVVAEKFIVKGIPTLLIITGDQEEVGRVLDYQPMDRMNQFLTSINEDPVPIRELTEKARGKDQAVMARLGKRLYAAGRYDEAVDVLEKVKPPPPEFLSARVEAAGNDEKVLRAALKEEPSSSRSISWRTRLAGVLTRWEDKRKVREEGVALADDLLAHPEKLKEAVKTEAVGEMTGLEPFMVAMARADLVESSGASNAEIDAAWKKAGQVGTSLNIPTKNVGSSMRHLMVLTKAREYREADKLAQRLLKADPKNAELQRRRLRLMLELKDFDGAVKLGKKVIENSYGRNEIWAAETTAKAFIQTGKKKEAREFIEGYLARPEMDWPSMKSSRKTFEELRQKVAGG